MAIITTQGENKNFKMRITDADGEPFDLTSYPMRKVCLPLENDAKLEVTQDANLNGSVVSVVGDPLLGKLNVYVNFEDTLLLRSGTGQDIGVVINNADEDDPQPYTSEGVLTVKDAVC